MPAGRPSDYNPEIAAELCGRLAEGENLRQIARAEGMPSKTSIMRWLPKYPEFRDQYEKAMEMRWELMGEELLDIADDGTNDWMERQREHKGVAFVENAEAIARSRLRVDTRKWLMSKHLPKKYGDKLDHTLTGDITYQVVTGVPRSTDAGKSDD